MPVFSYSYSIELCHGKYHPFDYFYSKTCSSRDGISCSTWSYILDTITSTFMMYLYFINIYWNSSQWFICQLAHW